MWSHYQESDQCYTSNGSTLLFLQAKSMLTVGINGQKQPCGPTTRKVVSVTHLMETLKCHLLGVVSGTLQVH